jgi:hypothetical protein
MSQVAVGTSEPWQIAALDALFLGKAESLTHRGAKSSHEFAEFDFETRELEEAISAIAVIWPCGG